MLDINQKFLTEIKEKLPQGTVVANALMDILCLGKEAVYRRLRGEVPFTFQEVATISKKMGISLDRLVESSLSCGVFFELKSVAYWNPQEIDYFRLEEFLEVMDIVNKDPESEFTYTTNLFTEYPSVKYHYLSRLHSFKWLYQNMDRNIIMPFHKMELSQRLMDLKAKTADEVMNIKKSCFIWNDRLFEHPVEDIKFFREINLIRDEDIPELKADLLNVLSEYEIIAANGMYENGNEVQMFVTNQNFEATYFCIKGKPFYISLIGVSSSNYVSSLDYTAYETMNSWIQAIKKISSQISGSGEKQRMEFFNKQRKIIECL